MWRLLEIGFSGFLDSAFFVIIDSERQRAQHLARMGTFIGHVAPGVGFLLIGLWHLFNTIRSYARRPWGFETRPWFPVRFNGKLKLKHLELYIIMLGSLLSIASELFIFPEKHQPLANDWSIPPEHLNNFEHSTISLFLFMYAVIALSVDTLQIEIPFGLLHLLAAVAFSQELLLFHLHSSDHMGLEGHYHWLLQLIISVTLACTLLEVVWPPSFLTALVRCMSILFQGLWFIQMGFILWTPALTPAGCKLRDEELHRVVSCEDEVSEIRAKALANLQFSWHTAGVVIFTLISYLGATKFYTKRSKYEAIEQGDEEKNVELAIHQFRSRSLDGSHNSMEGISAVNVGR